MNIQIGNTRIQVQVDTTHHRIHLLDLDGPCSLTNALSSKYCRQVLEKFGLEEKYKEMSFICYHTDSEMSQYDPKTDNFTILSPIDERIDEDFKKEMYYLYG